MDYRAVRERMDLIGRMRLRVYRVADTVREMERDLREGANQPRDYWPMTIERMQVRVHILSNAAAALDAALADAREQCREYRDDE